MVTISIAMPQLVSLILQVEALGGFLAVLSFPGSCWRFHVNAGGAWDNSAIEDEPRDLAPTLVKALNGTKPVWLVIL